MKLLKIDSRGTDVYILQLALQRAGYLNEEPDGIFGRRTENAVLRFQQANGLKQDGIVGVRTWNALMPYLKGYIVHKTVKCFFGGHHGKIINFSIAALLFVQPVIK